MKRTEHQLSDLDASLWGPPPSPQEVAEAVEWHDNEKRRCMLGVLDYCLSVDHIAHRYGVKWDELMLAIKNKDILAINLGEAGYFIPTWQFDDSKTNELSMRHSIMQLWEAWGKGDSAMGSQLDFCKVLSVKSEDAPTDTMTPLQQMQSGDISVVQRLIDAFESRMDVARYC